MPPKAGTGKKKKVEPIRQIGESDKVVAFLMPPPSEGQGIRRKPQTLKQKIAAAIKEYKESEKEKAELAKEKKARKAKETRARSRSSNAST